jgi:uncharacterized lipoprotein YddW (UPF0748 family)
MFNTLVRCKPALIALALAAACAGASTAFAQIGRPAEKPKPPPEAVYEIKARAGEVRATWLRLSDSDYLASPARTADTMKRLRDIGFNTVYVTVWQDGYPLFPSAIFQKAGGGPDRLPALAGRDLLGEALIEAHRNGLLFIASFDGGLVATRRDQEAPLVKAKPAWMLRDAKAAFAGPLNCSWLNPAHPEVRSFFSDLMREVSENYDIDGIQIDEHMCWPGPDLGHDEFTKAEFTKDVPPEKSPPPKGTPKDAAFTRWRTGKATSLVRLLADSIRKKRPGLIVSFAAPPQQEALEAWMCDWPLLAKGGIFDEVVIKTAAAGPEQFSATWTGVMAGLGERRASATVGLRALGDGSDLAWPDLRKEIETVRGAKAGGFAITPARSPLFTHSQGMIELFDVNKAGRTRHPLRPLDWRPGPLKPTSLNYRGQYMVVRGLPSGFYRVIIGGKEPGAWVESKLKIAEGAAQISKESAELLQNGGVVEFLVDRRNDNRQPIPDPDLAPIQPGPDAAPPRETPPGQTPTPASPGPGRERPPKGPAAPGGG